MINYSRLGYEMKRDFTNFSLKISKGLKRPQEKFVHQMIYGILAGNKLHLSEIACSRSMKRCFPLYIFCILAAMETACRCGRQCQDTHESKCQQS